MIDHKKIIARLAEKWPAKVISVVVAIFLFAFHRMSDFQERFFSVPLQLDISANLAPASSYPRNVRITLRGTNTIYHISETDIEAHLDLTGYSEPGLYKAQIQIQRKGSASETEILEIIVDPPELSLELDTRITKSVPLSPNFQGYPEKGFEMVSYSLEPNQVVIDGPMKLLNSITELSTDFIDLEGRSADFSANVRIVSPNQFLNIRGDDTAEFRAFIKGLIFINTFDNIPITVKALAGEFEAVLDPPSASVKIQSVKEEIKTEMILAAVDCSGINTPGSYELPLLVESREEIKVDRCEPETVKVEVIRKEDR